MIIRERVRVGARTKTKTGTKRGNGVLLVVIVIGIISLSLLTYMGISHSIKSIGEEDCISVDHINNLDKVGTIWLSKLEKIRLECESYIVTGKDLSTADIERLKMNHLENEIKLQCLSKDDVEVYVERVSSVLIKVQIKERVQGERVQAQYQINLDKVRVLTQCTTEI